MFGHAKADTVVDDMLQTLEELALPLRLMLSLGMDGPNVLTGLRSVKAAIQEYGGVDKVPITLDTVKTAENSCRLYNEHLREENAKKRQTEAERLKHEGHKRKLEEMKAEEKNLHETL